MSAPADLNKSLAWFTDAAIEAGILTPGDTLTYHPGSRINGVSPSITRTDAAGSLHAYTLFTFKYTTQAREAEAAIDAAYEALRAANAVRSTK